jgi:hypothetical protein
MDARIIRGTHMLALASRQFLFFHDRATAATSVHSGC